MIEKMKSLHFGKWLFERQMQKCLVYAAHRQSLHMPAKCLKASGTHGAFKDKTIHSENLSFLSLMTIFTSSITMCNFYAIKFPLFKHSYVFKCVGVNILCHRRRKSLFHCIQGCLGENFHVWCVKNKEIIKPYRLLTVKPDGAKENIKLKISPNYFHVFPYLAYI